MSRKTRTPCKNKMANEAVARLVNEDHDQMMAKGYQLTRASRVWLRADHGTTVRLVYRHNKPDIQKALWKSVVFTYRFRDDAP